MSGELRFDNVSIRYGTGRRAATAVRDFDLVVPDGSVLGLVGESGSGKSSLARAAVGLTPVSAGRILLNGAPVDHRGRRPLQMVFQDPFASLDPRMSVGRSVGEAARGRSRTQRREQVLHTLELVGLPGEYATMYPAQLSGGQRQRVAIARALVAAPEVLIADEITSALDVSIQGTILNLVRSVQQELGMTTLFISHNLAVVRYVATHIAVLCRGRLLEHGPAESLLAEPQHDYTKELLAAATDIRSHGRSRFKTLPVNESISVNESITP